MKIQEMIRIVQFYFKDKIVAGEYELVGSSQHEIKITIDNYPFSLWMSNGPSFFRVYTGTGQSFMPVTPFETHAEKEHAYNIAKERKAAFDEINKESVRIQKIQKLKDELKQLEGEEVGDE